MKYLKIKITNHSLMGNLELDLTNSVGYPYDTILLAGENGTGKTAFLNVLYSFDLNRNPNMHGVVEIDVLLTDEERESISSFVSTTYSNNNFDEILNNRMKIIMDYDNHNALYHGIVSFQNKDGNRIEESASIISSFLKTVYSGVEINYNTTKITNVSSQDLDADNVTRERSNEKTATDIKQLLIDIISSDAEILDTWVNENPGVVPPQEVIRPKIKRFVSAYNSMFTSKKLRGVDTVEGGKTIMFEENNKQMSIDDLSSGEKQVVFRGAFLLRNQRSVKGCVVLIDEPEISMHPKWDMKILSYFKNLFINTETGIQESQLFVATHSEYVIKSVLNDMTHNLVIVFKKDDVGNMSVTKVTAPIKLQQITDAEINYQAFGVYSTDYHIQLYGALQYRHGFDTIKACDNYIMNTPQYLAGSERYKKHSLYKNPRNGYVTNYETLPTYIRNAIDHPNSGNVYNDEELSISTELLRSLL